MWSGHKVRYCVLAQWLCAAIYVTPILFVGVYAERNDDTDYVTLYFSDKTVEYVSSKALFQSISQFLQIYYGSIMLLGVVLANSVVLVPGA